MISNTGTAATLETRTQNYYNPCAPYVAYFNSLSFLLNICTRDSSWLISMDVEINGLHKKKAQWQ